MSTIPQVSRIMQECLIEVAERLGREVGFVQRVRKLTGAKFVQILVCAFQSNPQASYSDLRQTGASLGVEVSQQGLEQRFTPEAVRLLEGVLAHTTQQVIASQPVAVELLRRFRGVYLQDSSTISLPASLVSVWPGAGGSQGASAALKLHVRWEFNTGMLQGPCVQDGRKHDQNSPLQEVELAPGSLRLADLGYFNLKKMAQENAHGVYWITRFKHGTKLWDENGQALDLLAWLQSQTATQIDCQVKLGQHEQIPCRLIAIRVSQRVVDQRRRQLREYARKKQVPLKQERLKLAAWTLFLTNVPQATLSWTDVTIMARLRWQIELIFKLWKTSGRLDEWRSQKPERILCELYAKLIGLIMFHWIALTALWGYPERSLVNAIKIMQTYAVLIAIALAGNTLTSALMLVKKCMVATCRMGKRRTHPNAYQLLCCDA